MTRKSTTADVTMTVMVILIEASTVAVRTVAMTLRAHVPYFTVGCQHSLTNLLVRFGWKLS